MPSETDVANRCLQELGVEPISTLTEGSERANTLLAVFAQKRDELLRKNAWDFCRTRVQLAQSSVAPAFEFDYAYVLPSDWIRTIRVTDNDAGTGAVYHKTELHEGQRSVLANVEQLYLQYVKRITDPNLMAPDFITAWVEELKKSVAVPLAGSNTLMGEARKDAAKTTAAARSTDSMGSTPARRPRGSWASARGGWRRHPLTHTD